LPGAARAGRIEDGRGAALKVFFTAAHGGFARECAPLGGGAAVFEQLKSEWERTRPFELIPLTPEILGSNAPRGHDLTKFDEKTYAAFSRAFERACTEEILKHDPSTCAVLANDISEGPDFETLASRGYRVFTIFHVDVVDYVARLYFRGLIAPETTVRWYRRLRPLMPDMAALVWAKQEAVVRGSCGLIVPSPRMRDVLLRCYPECPPERIHVLPWGNWHSTEPVDRASVDALRSELNIPADARVVLTLSRISPEKGQDRLLESFLDYERRNPAPRDPAYIVICGEPAFMQGQRHMARLRVLASQLKSTRVLFPGHVTGDRKRAFFGLADVYTFPSRHESYGLTLMEAMASGLPCVATDTHGARSVMQPEFGEIVEPQQLALTIMRLLNAPATRERMGSAARNFVRAESFSKRAAELACIMHA
jgi:glycosyltransferase involved in cell wall biosynthesis